MDASHKIGSDGMKETRCTTDRDLDQNCQEKPDFIQDVLLQKDLYASYNMIQANPAYEPSYTFIQPESPSTDCNPTFIVNETDEQQTLVTQEYGAISLTVDPTFNTVWEDLNYDDSPTQQWEQNMTFDSRPAFSGAHNDILPNFNPCMEGRQGADMAAVDVPQLTMNEIPIERTIDVSDYELDTFIQMEQEGLNIDLEEPNLSHIKHEIRTESADEIDQKRGITDLDVSELPQLSMDAIPMENILEGSEYKEVCSMHLDRDDMNVDSFSQILSGLENDIASNPIDMNTSCDLQGNNNAIPTEQTEEMSEFLAKKENPEAFILERNILSPVPLGTLPGKPSFEGQSRSLSPIDSRERYIKSNSLSCGRYKSPTSNHCNSSKLLRQSQSPFESRGRHYRRSLSRSVTNSRSSHRRSCSDSRSGNCSRDQHRISYSRSRSPTKRKNHCIPQSLMQSQSLGKSRDHLHRRSPSRSETNSRNSHRRSCSGSWSWFYSGDQHRRSYSRSRSPANRRNYCSPSKLLTQSRSTVKLRDHRMSPSRSVTNSRTSHRRILSQSHSGIYSRDHDRRSYSRFRVSSRDCMRRSQSRLKFGIDSRNCSRRTLSRSRYPLTFRDHRSRSHSRSDSNSRGFHRSPSQSPRGPRDLQRPSPRSDRTRQRSPELPSCKQIVNCYRSRRSPTPLKQQLSSPPPVR